MINVSSVLLRFKYLKNEKCVVDDIIQKTKIEIKSLIASIQKTINVFDLDLDTPYHIPEKNVNTRDAEGFHSSENQEDVGEEAGKAQHESPPPWAKKVFRKIATITHPDKLPSNLSPSLKKNLDNFYKQAVDAYEDLNLLEILEISHSLGMEMPDIDQETLRKFEQDCKTLEVEVSQLKLSEFWIYSQSSLEKKEKMISEFIKTKGWDTSSSQRKKSRPGHPGQSISWLRKNMK